MDYPSPEAFLTLIKHHRLTGRDGALRHIESHAQPVRMRLKDTGLIRLAVTYLGRRPARRGGRRAGDPVYRPCNQGRAVERRMVLALLDIKDVVRHVFVHYVPGLSR